MERYVRVDWPDSQKWQDMAYTDPKLDICLYEESAFVPEELYEKTEGTKKDGYWQDIAKGLRELWPAGEKDGKYPWRDSVANISKRLHLLWQLRFSDKNYTKDQILLVARKYLAQFEHNNKYMQILKYFILKQGKMVNTNTGKIKYINESKLADMLEAAEDQGWFAELNTDITEDLIFAEEGELI